MAARSLFRLFVMHHPDEDTRRRGQNLLVILAGLTLISLLSLPISFLNDRIGSMLNVALSVPLAASLIVLTRQGRVNLAALIAVSSSMASLVLALALDWAQFGIIVHYVIFSLLIAGLTMRPRAIWLTFGMSVVGLAIMTFVAQGRPAEPISELVNGLNAGLTLTFILLITLLGSTTTARALADARAAREEALRASQALAQSNADLERQVAERTAALRAALAEREAQALALQEALDSRERMSELVAELSLPAIPVSRDILVVPLVGAIDGARAGLLLQRVLSQIEARHVRSLILDVTGLPLIDTDLAEALLATASAARLLGARVTLVGIRPEVAQALVGLGVGLAALDARATLEQALQGLITKSERGRS